MAENPLLQKFLDMRRENVANLLTLGGQLDAMVREGAKDIRQTFNEVFFGKGEHAPEAGAPGNPTQFMANDALIPERFSKAKDSPELEM